MVEIKAEDFAKLLNSDDTGNILGLVRKIKQLQFKLDNPGKQSWYFRKGIDSKKRRFDNLKIQYNKIRNIAKNKSYEEIDKKLASLKEEIEKRKSMYGFVATIGTNIVKSEYNYGETIKEVKSRYGNLPDFNELLDLGMT